jgi:hypothetical protein
MGMNQRLMRPRASGRNEIVDIEWTADGGGLRASVGGTVFPAITDTATIASAFAADYGGNPTVAVNGSSGSTRRYRVKFHDGLDKDVEMEVDGELYTTDPVMISIVETTPGVVGAKERFTFNAGPDNGIASVENGTTSCFVESEGTVITAITPPSGFSVIAGGVGQSFAVFEANTMVAVDDFSITSDPTNGATLTDYLQGASAVQEVQRIDLGGADSGSWSKTNGVNFTLGVNASSSVVGVALNDATAPPTPGLNVTVTGSDGGPYDVTFDEAGPKDLIPLTATLFEHTSTADTLQVTVVKEGG